MNIPPIIEVGDVLVSSDIITERFCCDLDACKGICCVEGDAGAPVTLDEIEGIEDALDTVWGDMSARAQSVVDRQGVAYTDRDGDLVTSIVDGKDCVFTCYVRSRARLPQREDRFLQTDKLRSLSHTRETACQRRHGSQLQQMGRVPRRGEERREGRHSAIPVPARAADKKIRSGMV